MRSGVTVLLNFHELCHHNTGPGKCGTPYAARFSVPFLIVIVVILPQWVSVTDAEVYDMSGSAPYPKAPVRTHSLPSYVFLPSRAMRLHSGYTGSVLAKTLYNGYVINTSTTVASNG